MTLRRAVFLDKDGTLIENVEYNIDPARIRLYHGVPEALKKLKDHGFSLIVVSNQPGVAHGYFEEEALSNVWNSIQSLLMPAGVQIDRFLYCPHHPMGSVHKYSFDCSCRKPRPGLFLEAAEKEMIDLRGSWMIGDILHDVEAGKKAGCRTILINNGNETEWHLNKRRKPDYVVDEFTEAAKMILLNES